MELPYAGLHMLLFGLLDRVGSLPEPRRDALEVALGLRAGPVPGPFLIGLSVLVFVMRTIGAVFSRLPELALTGLAEADAKRLLAQLVVAPIDGRIRDQILAEAKGNPLALRELPLGRSPADLAGGFTVNDAMPLATRIENSLLDRISGLRADARQVMLLAAADPTGDPSLLRRAVRALSIDGEAVEEAERTGDLTIDSRVEFRHPLIRSGIYRAVSPPERRRSHAVLAEATIAEDDPDRRAWHRGYATVEPDESVAAELDGSSVRARRRGGVSAAAAFLERAAALSPAPSDRARRMLAAAQAKLDAGAPEAARILLENLPVAALDRRGSGLAGLLLAQADFARSRTPEIAHDILAAARQLAGVDAELTRSAQYGALRVAIAQGGRPDDDADHGPGVDGYPWRDICQEVFDETDPDSTHPVDVLIRGQALIEIGARAEAVPVLRTALAGLLDSPVDLIPPQSIGLEAIAAADVWDVQTLLALCQRQIVSARSEGLLTALPIILSYAGTACLNLGRLDKAELLVDEVDVIGEAIGYTFPPHTRVQLAAWRGDSAEVARHTAELRRGAAATGDGAPLSTAHYAEATLANGLGRYEDAVRAGSVELAHIRQVTFTSRIASELVEAATQTGAEDHHHCEAIERLGRGGLAAHQGRARLAYGEWLRRQRRRVDAREQLQAAHSVLSSRGAAGFAARAKSALEATGGTVHSRKADPENVLTSQEANVTQSALSVPSVWAHRTVVHAGGTQS